MEPQILLRILEENVFLTVGCTDPVAAGLAAAISYKAIGGEIESIRVTLDKNVYKDAIAVGIPGTKRKGLDLAVALCLISGDPNNGLSMLKDVNSEDIVKAEKLLSKHKICFTVNEKARGIFVRADIKTSNGTASALLLDSHDNLVEVTVNGKVVYSKLQSSEKGKFFVPLSEIERLSIRDVLDFVKIIDSSKISFLNTGIEVNMAAASLGEKSEVGIGMGKLYSEMIEKGILSDGIINRTKQKVGAAADARMFGMNIPIYGCFGSGNHGITLFITLGMVGEHIRAEKGKVLEAIAIALLITGLIKSKTGILTPHCGCSVAAGTGAAAGIVYLLGGKEKEIENAIHLMIANLTGMICDGAKYSCSLKMATSAGAAIEAAYMAMLGAEVPGDNGIVGYNLSETMENLRMLTEQGMKDTDRTILGILLQKTKSSKLK